MRNDIEALWAFEGFSGAGSMLNRQTMQESQQDELCLEEDSPWNRCGLPDPPTNGHFSKRLLHGFIIASAWLAMPLAVLTIHGWVGLIVHGLALSGAAGLLQRATIQTQVRLEQPEPTEGDGICASVKERI